jgi:cytochrome P450
MADVAPWRHSKQNPMAIATLPMLNGKVYAVWSPSLIQASLRSKEMSFDFFSIQFAARMLGIDKTSEKLIQTELNTGESFLHAAMSAMANALRGEALQKMNGVALDYIAEYLNDIPAAGKGKGLNISNVWQWSRDFITTATMEALYGEHNPFRGDEGGELRQALYDYDDYAETLIPGIAPSILARKAVAAQNKLAKGLGEHFYNHQYDQTRTDIAELTRDRAGTLRQNGIADDQIPFFEIGLVFTATVNSAPTFFWMFANIWLRPQLVAQLRDEAIKAVEMKPSSENGKRKAIVSTATLEERQPLLVSVYRESLRRASVVVGTRRVVHDMTLVDDDGTAYFLKGGVDVMWSGKTMHRTSNPWGDDVLEFKADRFVVPASSSAKETKERSARMKSYAPFGGGKHYCPGRNFAFAEILGFMTACVLGFEVEGLKAENVKEKVVPNMGEAIVKPPKNGEGGPITLRRRDGWEDVEWSFSVEGSEHRSNAAEKV